MCQHVQSWRITFEFVMLDDSCVFQSSELLALTRGDISGAYLCQHHNPSPVRITNIIDLPSLKLCTRHSRSH